LIRPRDEKRAQIRVIISVFDITYIYIEIQKAGVRKLRHSNIWISDQFRSRTSAFTCVIHRCNDVLHGVFVTYVKW
jgi:hypothetical protein